MTRADLYALIRKKNSCLCIGLDTDPLKIPKHLVSSDDPVFEFNRQIIDATHAYGVAYKPNIAFYEALGPKGWESLQKTLDYIAQSLAKGDKVELRNFGVFEVKVRKARVGRNPNAPETDVPIPQRAVVKFKPGKEMRETVIKLTPEQVEAALKAQAAEEENKGPEDQH